MREKSRAAVLAAFAGDCLALGPHWIYDQARIAREFPGLSAPAAPLEDSYHKGKSLGDLTHYGDQMLTLLESLAACGGWDRSDFARRWQELFAGGAPIYLDNATRRTLDNIATGWPVEDAGSLSDDLAGACRFSPLLAFVRDEEALAAAAREQAGLTHKAPTVLAAAGFFARTASRILAGIAPVQAMREAVSACAAPVLVPLLEAGLASAGRDTLAVISEFGQNCHFESAFPCVVHLVAAHPADLGGALVRSTLAGGDSAARNIAVGCLLGAALGTDAIPAAWLETMNASNRIKAILP